MIYRWQIYGDVYLPPVNQKRIALLSIPYIEVQRDEMITEERAISHEKVLLQHEVDMERRHTEAGQIYTSNVHSIGRQGSVVVTMRFADIAAFQITDLFHHEQMNRDATALIAGRKLLPAHNGAEHGSGLTDGLLEWDL